MFLDLIKLHENNSIPLEDFNTESFAGILNLHQRVKKSFIKNFLKLPEDNYHIETQLRKKIEGRPNCIIDLVIIGENNVCFIENKVNSSEGYEQLLRYGIVLEEHYKHHKKFLFYCTKHTDIKNTNNEYSAYNFEQFKWFEIAKFLEQFQNDIPLIKDYLIFLNHHKMAQDNTFRPENLITFQNMLKSIQIAEFYIDNCKSDFDKIFNNDSPKSFFNTNDVYEHESICNYKSNILNSSNDKYSEILYGINFENLYISTHIHLKSDHEYIEAFNNLNIKDYGLKKSKMDYGTSIYMLDSLGHYINDRRSDKLITDWFIRSFRNMKKLMDDNNQLPWVT